MLLRRKMAATPGLERRERERLSRAVTSVVRTSSAIDSGQQRIRDTQREERRTEKASDEGGVLGILTGWSDFGRASPVAGPKDGEERLDGGLVVAELPHEGDDLGREELAAST